MKKGGKKEERITKEEVRRIRNFMVREARI